MPNRLGLNEDGSPGKEFKWHRLAAPWVAHLAGNAAGLALRTVLVAADGDLVLPPLRQDAAAQWLDQLAQAWRAGMMAPPPVAVRTAFAWLATPEDKQPREQARRVYEGGFQARGERDRSLYLARQFPDFDSLWSDGGFAEWARTLYGPLHDAVAGRAEQP